MKKLISVIVPCYNEEESLPLFYPEMAKIMDKMNNQEFELLFINDGSRDHTLEELKKLSKKDKRVKFISFSRNFGKEAAILAGLQHVQGDYVTLMDADLQDPPSMLLQMFDLLLKENLDIVGLKADNHKNYSFLRKFFTASYYKLAGMFSTVPMAPNERDYRLMTRQVVDSILELTEYNRYSKGLFNFVGYKTKWITYDTPDRAAGTTKWNFWKLFAYGIDGIVGFSTKPLIISAIIGCVLLFISFVLFIIMIVKACIHNPVDSLFSIYLLVNFMGGLILFFLGVVGEYLAKTYLEVKNRPRYIIKETEKGSYKQERNNI